MTLAGLLPQTVTVVHYDDGARNAHGNKARVEASRTEGVPARLWQESSSEEQATREAVTDRWNLVVGPAVVLDAGDEVLLGVKRFRVDGTPDVVYGRGAPHHIEANLIYEGDVA